MQILEVDKKEQFKVDVAEELVVAISQYMAVEYTKKAINALKKDGIPFTTIVLYDGTPYTKFRQLNHLVDIAIQIKKPIHSLPHLWNILWGVAKLTKAKYLFWSDCDIELRQGSLKEMMKTIAICDIVSPVKIYGDNKLENYKPIYNESKEIIGFNDSAALFRLDEFPFFPLSEDYAPYQFEVSALAYDLWRKNWKSMLNPYAVGYHYGSKDIEHSPETRKDSKNWDKKKKLFRSSEPLGDSLVDRIFFIDKVLMNSEMANKVGFPCLLKEDSYD